MVESTTKDIYPTAKAMPTPKSTPIKEEVTPSISEDKKEDKPQVDVLTFLQNISKEIKFSQTQSYPVSISDKIDDYVRKLGAGNIEGYHVKHVDGKARAIPGSPTTPSVANTPVTHKVV